MASDRIRVSRHYFAGEARPRVPCHQKLIDFDIRLRRGRMLWPAPRRKTAPCARFGRANGVILGGWQVYELVRLVCVLNRSHGRSCVMGCDLALLAVPWGSPGAWLE